MSDDNMTMNAAKWDELWNPDKGWPSSKEIRKFANKIEWRDGPGPAMPNQLISPRFNKNGTTYLIPGFPQEKGDRIVLVCGANEKSQASQPICGYSIIFRKHADSQWYRLDSAQRDTEGSA